MVGYLKMRLQNIVSSIALLTGLAPVMAEAADVQPLTVMGQQDDLGVVEYMNGKEAGFTIGLGSGAFRHPNDPADEIYVVADRGPNFTCKAAAKIIGPEVKEPCAAVKKGRFYPLPKYTPSIYRLKLDAAEAKFSIIETIPLKTASGRLIDGMLNPLTVATTEQPLDAQGEKLALNADAVDAEGIVKLSDGTFWIGEEMGPSILHVSKDGRILKRLVPAGTEKDFATADTEIVGALPAILAKRQANRGIESMAISPDEKFLYFIMQNPLANPDKATYLKAKNTRLFKIERESLKIVGEYVYQLDDPQSFKLDPSKKQNSPRISEMAALDTDRLLVLERTNKTTKFHEISLERATNILGTKWDELATTPSLESENDLKTLKITPTAKTLRFDTATDYKDAPGKLEGIAFLPGGDVAFINDNDFAIKGDPTIVLIVKGSNIKAAGF